MSAGPKQSPEAPKLKTSPRPVVAVVFGTRPEAIKMIPVIRELNLHNETIQTVTISTGQHRQMLDQVLVPFQVTVDYDMCLMEPRQSLFALSSHAMAAFERVLTTYKPSLVLVQGDTVTAFVGALCASYAKIPVGHVEAGLRTNNKHFPFPEEINRRLISVTTDLHFAPTEGNRQNLLREGIGAEKIFVTGNTGIDALVAALKLRVPVKLPLLNGNRLVLLTLHRREIFGDGVREILFAVRELATAVPDIVVLYPVHLNPNVRTPAREILSGVDNVIMTEPLDYFTFVHAMSSAHLILTDSGGVQEEAPTFGAPVLVLRKETERLEGLQAAAVRLAGTDRSTIVRNAIMVLANQNRCRYPAGAANNPYGDGKASARIVQQILRFFQIPDHGIYDGLEGFRSSAQPTPRGIRVAGNPQHALGEEIPAGVTRDSG